MNNSKFRAVAFLDRDGTVIVEKHYLSDPDQVVLLPNAAHAIRRLNTAGVAVVLITNQSGVARGYFDEARVHMVHERLRAYLEAENARLDGVYFCPHLSSATLVEYRRDCSCRKPGPGMIVRAREELGLKGLPAYVVGDKACDLGLARSCDVEAILVRTGYGAQTEKEVSTWQQPPAAIVDDVSAAVAWLLAALKTALPEQTGD